MDRSRQPRLVTGRRLAAVAMLVGLLGAVAFAYLRFGLSPTLTVSGLRLTISTVRTGTFHDYIPITGSVVPGSSVVVAAVDGGQVTEVFVEAGALVEAGQPLVALKNTALQLEVIGREAQLAEQINNLGVTRLAFERNRLGHKRTLIEIDYRIGTIERQLERLEQLDGVGGSTPEQIQELRAEHRYQTELRQAVAESQRVDAHAQRDQIGTLQVAVDSLKRNIGIARENLENLTLRAPIGGQLTSLEAHVGESKSQGQRIAKIDDADSFKVSALVDEFYLTRVHEGQSATVEIDGGRHLLAVAKVYPEVRNRQFEIDLAFAEMPNTVRRGQTLRMRLEIGASTETLTLANGPFYDDSGGQWVYVLEPGGERAARREVRLGRRTPEQIEVLGGLAEGEQVVTSSYRAFGEATTLRLDAGA